MFGFGQAVQWKRWETQSAEKGIQMCILKLLHNFLNLTFNCQIKWVSSFQICLPSLRISRICWIELLKERKQETWLRQTKSESKGILYLRNCEHILSIIF